MSRRQLAVVCFIFTLPPPPPPPPPPTHTHTHTSTDLLYVLAPAQCDRGRSCRYAPSQVIAADKKPAIALGQQTALVAGGVCGCVGGGGGRGGLMHDDLFSALLSPFLIGRMFVREPSWKYSANLVGSLTGRTFLRGPSWKYSSNCDKTISGVQKALLNMFWEHSPYSTNVPSDWLKAELSCGGGRNKNKNG